MNSNTIVMRLLEKEVARSRGLFQYDYGQRLVFTGVELPDAYEVHFSNNKVGVSKTVIGDATGVDIPDEFLLKGDPVYVWVFLHTGDADGETEYHGVIDVIKRAKPVHDKPTPVQQDEITQAIAVLNAAVTTTGQDVVDTTEAKDAAEAAQAAAEEAQEIAEDARDEAVQAKNTAVGAAEAAEAAKDAAVEAKETSEEIAEALPGTIEAALQEAKDSGEFDGATFVPSIDDGVISWTNDRQLPNPEPVDIAEELELDTYAKKDEIPTKVSELTNDSGYLTTETDPTVSAWAKQPNKPSYTAQEVGAIDVAQKGTANGVAELGADGKVKSGQLPSYVDDVVEYDSMSQFPATGESGKIYIAKDTNITYRWGGSSYVPIGSDLALGETASTAYRGDRGKIAYDHASAKGNAYANGLYKIATNAEGHVTGATPVAKSDITGLGIPGSVPTKTSELQNDSGFITTETDPTVASWAKEPTKPTYTASEVGLGNVANERQYSANNPPPADTTKQNKINVNGILKGTGNGGVTAAVEGTDYINGDLIAVQDETPTDPNTQIWLPETQPESVQVASYAELTDVLNALNQKQEKPETTGSAGQVLGLALVDGQLVPVWVDQTDAVKYVLARKFNVGSNLLTDSTPFTGDGWSGSLSNGFTHATGNTDPITFEVSTVENQGYIIDFDFSGSIGGDEMYVSIGETPKVDVYHGSIRPFVGIVSDGGYLKIYCKSTYTGTITNLKIRAILENGGTEVIFECAEVNNGQTGNEISAWHNVAIGRDALGQNVNGTRSVAIGDRALEKMVTGHRNIAIGPYAMPFVTEGDCNISIGADTLYNPFMSTGESKAYSNVAIGKATMRNGTLVQNNIALGHGAMSENGLNAQENVCIGRQAGYNTSNNNTFIGYRAGYYYNGENGVDNVCIGHDAGVSPYHNGRNNVYIGAEARANVSGASASSIKTVNNSIAIGKGAKVDGSYQIVLGNANYTTVKIAGKTLSFNQDGTVTWS